MKFRSLIAALAATLLFAITAPASSNPLPPLPIIPAPPGIASPLAAIIGIGTFVCATSLIATGSQQPAFTTQRFGCVVLPPSCEDYRNAQTVRMDERFVSAWPLAVNVPLRCQSHPVVYKKAPRCVFHVGHKGCEE
jgi:hypothetical protein